MLLEDKTLRLLALTPEARAQAQHPGAAKDEVRGCGEGGLEDLTKSIQREQANKEHSRQRKLGMILHLLTCSRQSMCKKPAQRKQTRTSVLAQDLSL